MSILSRNTLVETNFLKLLQITLSVISMIAWFHYSYLTKGISEKFKLMPPKKFLSKEF